MKYGRWVHTAGYVFLLAMVCLLISPITKAEAHSTLIEMSPEKGTVIDKSPDELTMRFNEPVDKKLAKVMLYDWNANPVFAGSPNGDEGRAPIIRFSLPQLKQGTYTVKWSVVSLDGHPVEGSYTFSVGHATKNGAKSVSESGSTSGVLIMARSLTQGLIELSAGVYLFAMFAAKRKYPALRVLVKKRYLFWLLLFIASIAELAAYVASLPSGLPGMLFAGGWELIQQFPFIIMVFAQLIALMLMLIPGMLQGWYAALWFILAVIPAFGGHAWGMPSPLLSLIPRMVHQWSIAIWLGALGYMILLLIWQKRQKHEVAWQPFRKFFVRTVLTASILVAVSGLGLAYMQTGITAIFTNWMSWSTLLSVKVLFTLAMLGLALYQTLKWKRSGAFTTGRLIRTEWIIGLLIIVLGVWMSQIAYPVPSHTYDETLTSGKSKVQVHIADLRAGEQTMRIKLPEGTAKPEQVTVALDMPAHGMKGEPAPAKQINQDTFEITLPFSMSGKWFATIQASYPSGVKTWEAKLFIVGTGSL